MPLGVREQWIVQGLVQVVLLGTYVTARISRKTALAAVSELERAVRLAAHREALLLEAREELERALRSGTRPLHRPGDRRLPARLRARPRRDGRGLRGAPTPTGAEVAVKLLSQASLGNANHVLRFLRELRTAAGFESPHVVRVIDVGEQPGAVPRDGAARGQDARRHAAQPARPWLRGQVLRARTPGRCRASPLLPLPASSTATSSRRTCSRTTRRSWKLLDFGVARAIDSGDTLTAGPRRRHAVVHGARAGARRDRRSPHRPLRARRDRLSLAHRAPAVTPPARSPRRSTASSTRCRAGRASWSTLPPDVDLVLAIGLAKNPGRRFTSALELSDALHHAFAQTLPERVRNRGITLEREGAWSSPKHRPSTARLRGPGHEASRRAAHPPARARCPSPVAARR